MIGNSALAIWLTLDPAGEEDFNNWYPRQHLPERLSVAGFLRGRRYRAAGGAPPYFTLYELADARVLSSPAYLERLNHPTDWTRRVLPVIHGAIRNGCARLAASEPDTVEQHLLTVRIAPASGRGPAVRAWLAGECCRDTHRAPGRDRRGAPRAGDGRHGRRDRGARALRVRGPRRPALGRAVRGGRPGRGGRAARVLASVVYQDRRRGDGGLLPADVRAPLDLVSHPGGR